MPPSASRGTKANSPDKKPPMKLAEIWAIRIRLQMSSKVRELAPFNPSIDSKLLACDLTQLRVQTV